MRLTFDVYSVVDKPLRIERGCDIIPHIVSLVSAKVSEILVVANHVEAMLSSSKSNTNSVFHLNAMF